MPEHVNPDWGLEHLWVVNMNGGFLTKVDPMTSEPIEDIDLPIYPYALYYTLDGSKVMVVTNYIAQEDVGDNGVHTFEGVVHGSITLERKGASGFGYDPVFLPDGFSKTMAEMTLEEKNAISHRGLAVKKLVVYLKSLTSL